MKTKNEQRRALENDYPEKMLDHFGRSDFRFAILHRRSLESGSGKRKDEQRRAIENDYPEKVLDHFGALKFRFALLHGRFFWS